MSSGFDAESLPFNRKVRRAVEKARAAVIHLYAGATKERDPGFLPDGTCVLNVDVQSRVNMLRDDVFSYLLHVVSLGAIIGGPPCVTVSRLRDRREEDGVREGSELDMASRSSNNTGFKISRHRNGRKLRNTTS